MSGTSRARLINLTNISIQTDVLNIILEQMNTARDWAEQNYERYESYENLCGMCAIASSRLWMLLSTKNIKTRFIVADDVGNCHVFLEYNGLILDITATQFDRQPIVVFPLARATEWYWTPMYVWDNPLLLQQHQIENQWAKEQVAVVFDE